MTKSEINEKIRLSEFYGERLISRFRLVLAVIFFSSVPIVSVMRGMNGENYFPPQAYICCSLFFVYSVFVFFYLRKKNSVSRAFKYISVILDMTIHTGSIWIGCTYPEIAPAVTYLSIWALFFLVLIMVGAFRYSVFCAYFSGLFAGFCYLLAVVVNGKNIDLPYFFLIGNEAVKVSFPVFNEFFRVIAMVVTGLVTGTACKRRLSLFNTMIDSETATIEAASKTVEQTRGMAKVIQKSTDEIFVSSKEIFSTANNQAASVQEIESTINENAQIAGEIAEKTSSVADIASKMESDVIRGFLVLERNVNQMEAIKDKNDGVISGIIMLGNKIVKIREIVKSINMITDQTKVIAFNAALEASSAGEQGKRFSVVASEVNHLADDIAELTKRIREQIEEIQISSSSLVVSGEESADKINEGNSLVRELEEIFCDIRSGAEKTANQAQMITVSTQMQQKSTEHINIAIADISAGLSSFLHSTEVASASAGGLTLMIEELEDFLNMTTKEGSWQ